MFDVGASELLMIVVVAIVIIGPKDMPMALRAAGRWIGKVRRMSNHFRAGVDAIIREAEMEEMRKEWDERNKRIMAEYPDASQPEGGAPDNLLPPQMEPLSAAGEVPDADAAAEAAIARAAPVKAPEHTAPSIGETEPGLPLDPPVPPAEGR